ncbi:hypothetical protein V8C42DRAFT_349835 [Trichoderma barbatum]
MGYTQHSTPKKARLRVFERQGREILKVDPDENSVRTRHNNPSLPETRGWKRALSDADLDSIEDLYEDEGFEARRLPWAAVAVESAAEIDACERTIKTALERRGIPKRIAMQVEFVDEEEAERRLIWAKETLQQRPQPELAGGLFF